MSNSSLVTYTKLSPNCTKPRTHAIDTITIHCTAGNKNSNAKATANLERFVTADSTNGASCNYVVGGDGSVALVVDEANRSWCSSNKANDHRAVTIEVASNVAGTEVNDAAYQKLLDLVTDICKRNGIKKLVWSTTKNDRVNHLNGCNMTVHRDYAAKSCPGEWLYSRHGQIAEEVNKRLGSTTTTTTTTTAAATTQTAATTTTTTGSSYLVTVTAGVLNVRKGPGTGYAVATQVKKGEVYTIVETQGDWGKLKSGAGWICLTYTKKKS
jgi:hypothetical protein